MYWICNVIMNVPFKGGELSSGRFDFSKQMDLPNHSTVPESNSHTISCTLNDVKKFKKEHGIPANCRRKRTAEELKRKSPKFKTVPMETILKLLELLQKKRSHIKGSDAGNHSISCTYISETAQLLPPKVLYIHKRDISLYNEWYGEHAAPIMEYVPCSPEST